MEVILGISAYYHDSAASLIMDGKIIAAAQEERFTRKKGDSSFPNNAINYCLNEGKIALKNVTKIVFYEDYLLKFQRILMMHHLNVPSGLPSFLVSIPKWLTVNLWLEKQIKKELNTKKKIHFCSHHLSHAASAFYPSPYEKSAILTIDGVGEWATTTYGYGDSDKIEILKEIRFPDSIGLLYSAFTYYTGFKINSGEYKLMGLAPYGKPIYEELIKKELIKIYDDGSIKLNTKYFNFEKGLKMTNKAFNNLFGGKPRKPESEVTQKEMDIAASIQQVINEIVLKMANHIYNKINCDNLVLAGGVALNVVSIGYLKQKSKFKNIWVQPAAGDAGGSLGCALYEYYKNNQRKVNLSDDMNGAFLGPGIEPTNPRIDEQLKKLGAQFTILSDEQLLDKITEYLVNDKVVGIARDRMEFGPRALGHRSILANAQNLETQSILNLKIKKRESFRPFAPIVLKEDAKEYFDINDESPYMLSTYYIKEERRIKQNNNLSGLDLLKQKRSDIPAITHIDYSARVQTVDKKRNPFTYEILKLYKEKTKCSVLVNTSFNVRGEPIVNTEIDAFNCFMNTDMDCVVIGNRFFEKQKQDKNIYTNKIKKVFKRGIELD